MRNKRTVLVLMLFMIAFAVSSVACAQAMPDRYRLADQPDVYVIHRTAKKSFAVDQGSGGTAIGAIVSNYESARLQQKLDLQDPIVHLKKVIVDTLRTQLALKNLRVFEEASHLTVLPLSKTERLVEQANEQSYQTQPGGKPEIPSAGPTFNEKYPTGVVIELATGHWGLDNYYRIRYYASVRVVDLGAPRILLAVNCPWVTLDPVDSKKLLLETGAGVVQAHVQLQVYTARAEGLLYSNDGALLKETLREAAENCADRVIPRFLGASRRGRESRATERRP